MNVADIFKHCQSLGPKIPWDTLTDSQDDFKRFLYFFALNCLAVWFLESYLPRRERCRRGMIRISSCFHWPSKGSTPSSPPPRAVCRLSLQSLISLIVKLPHKFPNTTTVVEVKLNKSLISKMQCRLRNHKQHKITTNLFTGSTPLYKKSQPLNENKWNNTFRTN